MTGGGPGLESGILFRRGAVRAAILANRTAAYADPDGHVSRHLDNFHVMADGSVFAQALHVGGGDSTGSLAGEVLPAAGLSVDGTGAVALGSTSAAATPRVEFDSGRASACRISGGAGSTLDLACRDPVSGRLLDDLTLRPDGAAFRVAAAFPSIRVGGAAVSGGLVADTLATGRLQARGGVVAAETTRRRLRPDDCGTTIRDTGPSAHAYSVPAGLPLGCHVEVLQEGRGAVSIVPEAGETMEAYGPASVTAGLHAYLQLIVDTPATFNVHR